jgi:hypothetical protein
MTDVLDILNTLIHEDHHWLARVGRRERLESQFWRMNCQMFS